MHLLASYYSVTRLGELLDFGQLSKPLATINLPKSPTFLGNFCKVVKIYHISSEIIFGQLLYRHLAIFFWSHCLLKSFQNTEDRYPLVPT